MSKLLSLNGLPILDAKKPTIVVVNKNDIARASRKDPTDCPFARAIRRELHACDAQVYLGRTYVKTNKGSYTRYRTPPAMRTELITFDRGGKFEPGEYVMGAIPPTQRKKVAKAKRAERKKTARRARSRRKYSVVGNVRNGPV